MEKKIDFTPTVLLIDANELDRLVGQLTPFLEQQIGRKLDKMPIDYFTSYLSLEAAVKPNKEQEIQTLWIYEPSQNKMNHCVPAELNKDYSNMAFRNEIAEFSLNAFTAEDFAQTGDLYVESLQLLLEDKKVNRVVVFPPKDKLSEIESLLEKQEKAKEVIVFTDSGKYLQTKDENRERVVLYPIMKALGVKGDEV
jgi:hypothetical protein